MAQEVGVAHYDILVIDPERLFRDTQLGQGMLAEHQGKRNALAARNAALASELEAEEQQLADARSELAPDAFRTLADVFNEKVQGIRRDSERRVIALERERELLPRLFLRQVEPVILDLMREAGGVVLLDQRTVIFHASAVDVTDIAISRINATVEPVPVTPENSQDTPKVPE